MTRNDDRRLAYDAEQPKVKENTLLPMLLGGLALVVIGAGVVMTIV